ncbi:MAG: alpha-glucan family phosphorylase [Deltaproteobacteria bacterium]|nr:MAG: alpha-glucan family phosphorylase [Deltaproteobacteria bacterium]
MNPATALTPLAHDLWWCWDDDMPSIWRQIDPWRWDRNRNNPIALIADTPESRWAELAEDEAFVEAVDAAVARWKAYRAEGLDESQPRVAYLSMEYGLHESVRIYSGGLGVLAGDHLKSASDLRTNLVAVGLLYRSGYFRQVMDDGEQLAAYPQAEWERMPIELCRSEDGRPVIIGVPIADELVHAAVWKLQVGRVSLYLLDTDLPGAPHHHSELTAQLYGGDGWMRIRQEVLLGIGGMRALTALGEAIDVIHMNEGHCAFAVLERSLGRGEDLASAVEATRDELVFTTHTPVPAGHDRFGADMVAKALSGWCRETGTPASAVVELGRIRPNDPYETLCMTVVALKGAHKTNGVAELHGHTSRAMWHALWPDRPVDDVPIGHITNGVHPVFWTAVPTRKLFDRHIPGWRERPWDHELWQQVMAIPDDEIWALRRQLRSTLLAEVIRRGGPRMDPDALTIGFARRFAPYKRGDLLLSDPDRLADFLENTPAQVVFSGKAHPRDERGKQIVSRVARFAAQRRFRDRIAFVEDYDIAVGRLLTSGADVWLNNPRRPQEASGTSGQKVTLNGGINLSVLDGWWPEGFDGTNGWAIGDDRMRPDEPGSDAQDAEALYQLLGGEVAGEWTERGADGLPTAWIHRAKRSIVTCAPLFTSHRMVRDYTVGLYRR